jgi:arabinofuranosyltransferase
VKEITNPGKAIKQCLAPLFLAAALVVAAVVIFRAAWLCDDAYITFRVVENFVAGDGLRWNVAERVQVFTHPLWCLTLIAVRLVSGELPLSTILVSWFLAVAAIAAAAPWRSRAPWLSACLLLLIPASRSVSEYATSGLENALGFLLIAVLLAMFKKPEITGDTGFFLVVSLLVLTRHDLVLLAGPPAVAWLWFRRSHVKPKMVVLGTLPVVAWEAFSFVYYGSFLPNTAGAKLGSSDPLLDRLIQGLWYFGDFALHDPVGAGALVVALSLLVVRGDRRDRIIASGIVVYLAYVVWIGGDFMSGRFLAAPTFAAIAAAIGSVAAGAAVFTRPQRRWLGGAAAAMAVVGIGGFFPHSDQEPDARGVGDARRFWADALSYEALRDGRNVIRIGWVEQAILARNRAKPEVVIRGGLGLYGYYCGPTVHVIDKFALADPLLSRLPARAGSRIGHFERRLPEGYVESIATGRNLVADPDLRAYYDDIRAASRDPVFAPGRLGRLLALNSGLADGRLDAYLEREGAWHRERVQWEPRTSSWTIEFFYVD